MVKMVVDSGFILHRDDGSIKQFEKGEVEMTESDAVHWYVQVFAKPSSIKEPKKVK